MNSEEGIEHHQLVTLDRPCQHCKVLELDDAEQGGIIKQRKDGGRYVDFGVVQEAHSQRPGYGVATRAVMAGFGQTGDEVQTFPKLELKLGYKRNDILPDLPGLTSTGADGCGFCEILKGDVTSAWGKIRDGINDRLNDGEEELHQAKLEITEVSYQCYETSHDEDKLIYLDSLYVFFTLAWKDGQRDCSLHYNIHADATDPCASWFQIWRRTLPDNYLSPPSIRRMNELINKSLSQDSTTIRNEQYYPTRLLDVGSCTDATLRLVVSKANPELVEGERYAALSYCWGPLEEAEKQLKTTSKTIKEHISQVDFARLPQTVADAVHICRNLNIRYLWVDALCIIQGDDGDFAEESFKMSEIYANSFLTLCILQGNSCTSGFLKRVHTPKMLQVNFHSNLDSSVSGKLYLRMLQTPEENLQDSTSTFMSGVVSGNPDEPMKLDLDRASWNERGWTFQEAWLSPRKVFFGPLMFHLSCGNIHESANGSGFDGVDFFPRPNMTPGDLPKEWYGLVTNYGNRKLSYEKDRLPAISAFSRIISEKKPDQQYLAGLWKSDLHRGLLWTPYSWSDLQTYLERPKEFVPPTWSWAHRPNGLAWVRHGSGDLYPISPEFELSNYYIDTEPRNPYGRVLGGVLELDAKTYQFPLCRGGGSVVETPSDERRWLNVIFHYTLLSEEGEYIASLHLDWLTLGAKKNPDDLKELDQLWMVLISRSSLNNIYGHFYQSKDKYVTDPEIMLGLLLLPAGKEDEFFKVGLWYSETRGLGGSKFWDDIPRRPVKLV
ncbi:HET-domain-containing protein [Hypomontagnella monticulosa]|nr:HET-domain-containing protein [Hypomontagnella monticulosa]